ncbi:MAG: hypothetical protein A2W26_04270 [Acidobacteria bacterium RBG_16_64_8]|nr:MAG: hypothetical protein A2W26_04270 [Acidobacteria bacterium RBG_16_64_8]
MIDYAFVTIEQLRAICRVDAEDDSQDDWLERLTAAVTDYLERRLAKRIKKREDAYVETWSGEGGTVHKLKYAPVESIDDIEEIVVEDAATIDVTDDDQVRLESTDIAARVHLLEQTFWRGVLNCSCTYNPGWEAVPSDLVEACLLAIKLLWQQKDTNRELVTAVTVQGQTTHYALRKALTDPQIDDVLVRYEDLG